MPDNLNSIRRAADAWRGTGRRRLSQDIKARAVRLLDQYPSRDVAAAVRVSGAKVVERWRGSIDVANDATRREAALASPSSRPTSTFVELPVSMGSPDSEVEVQVLAAQGHRLQVRGRLGAAQLRALVGAALENGGGVA